MKEQMEKALRQAGQSQGVSEPEAKDREAEQSLGYARASLAIDVSTAPVRHGHCPTLDEIERGYGRSRY